VESESLCPYGGRVPKRSSSLGKTDSISAAVPNVRRNVRGRLVMPDAILLVEDKGVLREISGVLASVG
jgi:hypothetical protein